MQFVTTGVATSGRRARDKMLGWCAALLGFLLATAAPSMALITTVWFFLASYLLKKWGRADRQIYVPGLSLLLAHAGWIVTSWLTLRMINISIVYFVLDVTAAIHVYRRPTRNVIYKWAAVQAVIVVDYLSGLLLAKSAFVAVALVVHALLTALTIAALVSACRAQPEAQDGQVRPAFSTH